MFKKDVLAYFDPDESKPSVTARALNLTPGAVSQWGPIIPELQARDLDEMTRGKRNALKFRRDLYRRKRVA